MHERKYGFPLRLCRQDKMRSSERRWHITAPCTKMKGEITPPRAAHERFLSKQDALRQSNQMRRSERRWRITASCAKMKGEIAPPRAVHERFFVKARCKGEGILCVFQARGNAALAEKIRDPPQAAGSRLSNKVQWRQKWLILRLRSGLFSPWMNLSSPKEAVSLSHPSRPVSMTDTRLPLSPYRNPISAPNGQPR